MGFYEYIAEFAGLPVLRYPDHADAPVRPDGLAKPGDVAWRFQDRTGHHGDDGAIGFEAQFASFLETVEPSAVRAIIVGNWPDSYDRSSAFVVERLAAAADRLTGLRAVFLGEILGEEAEVSWIQQSDVSPLLLAYPRLEEFRVRGGTGLVLQPLAHSGLKKIVVEAGGLSGEFVRALDASTFPHLEHLELYLGVDEYGGDATASDLAEVLDGSKFPRLTYLCLRNAMAVNEFAEALADAPVVAQLLTLDLSLGALTDTGADALLQGQPLTHLELLDLHHHYLSDAMVERIEEAFLGTGTDVDVNEQEEPEEFDEDGEPEWLSIAHAE